MHGRVFDDTVLAVGYSLCIDGKKMIRIIYTLLFGLTCFIVGYQLQTDKYQPYNEFNKAVVQMKNYQYDWNTFDCNKFVEVFGSKLDRIGIKYTPIVIRQNTQYDHAIIAVWFDPMTGKFVNNGKYIRNLEEE